MITDAQSSTERPRRLPVGRIVATVIGLAAVVAFGYGLYWTSFGGECGRNLPACGPETGRGVIWLMVGSFVGMLTLIVGRALIVVPAALAVTALSQYLVWRDRPDHWDGFLVLAVVFAVLDVAVSFVIIGWLAVRGRRLKDAEDLVRTGIAVQGVIEEVKDTGTRINNNPMVRMTISFRRLDGTTSRVVRTRVVSLLDPPRVGEKLAVWYDASDPDRVVFGRGASQAVDDALGRGVLGPPGHASAGLSTDRAGEDTDLATLANQLERLSGLHAAGQLTDAEFAAAKAKLLGGS